MTFQQRYAILEDKFKERVQQDNETILKEHQVESYYLPNIEPVGPVDFVLVAMEPSSNAKLDDGTKTTPSNFCLTIDDFVFHYCAQYYLCCNEETYHITDIAKGAMKTEHAKKGRTKRWREWYPLLEEELQLVRKSDARVIAIGREVERFLSNQKPPGLVGSIFHYSKNNSTARTVAPQLFADQYREFSQGVSIDDVINLAREVMHFTVFDNYRDKIVQDLWNSGLSESSKMLMFTYKCLFDVIRGQPLI